MLCSQDDFSSQSEGFLQICQFRTWNGIGLILLFSDETHNSFKNGISVTQVVIIPDSLQVSIYNSEYAIKMMFCQISEQENTTDLFFLPSQNIIFYSFEVQNFRF